jgi:hypothetical protein
MTYNIRQEKRDTIKTLCRELISQPVVVIRDLAKLLGILQAADRALVVARLHYRRLQCCKIENIRGLMAVWSHLPLIARYKACYDMTCSLTQETRVELQWWIDNINSLPPGAILEEPWDLLIHTDACLEGYGAESCGEAFQGLWGEEHRGKDINQLEFIAAIRSLDYFTAHLRGVKVRLMVDNKSVEWYIYKMGGTRSLPLMGLALRFWELALSRDLSVEVDYIPSEENKAADLLSRKILNPYQVWSLDKGVFQELVEEVGCPSIDLFASQDNCQVPRYIAWKREQGAVAENAFHYNWDREALAYAFPRFKLVGKVLDKLRTHQDVTLILIAPVWKTRVWYPILLEMLVDHPILLGMNQQLILSQNQEPHPLLELGRLRLAAWKLSSRPEGPRDFQRMLAKSWSNGGPLAQSRLTRGLGNDGIAGVLNGVTIPFHHLYQS